MREEEGSASRWVAWEPLGVDATRSFSYLEWGGSSVAEGLAGTQETLALPLV